MNILTTEDARYMIKRHLKQLGNFFVKFQWKMQDEAS